MAKWQIPDLIPRSEAFRMAQEARGAALKEAADTAFKAACFVQIEPEAAWVLEEQRECCYDAILSLDPEAIAAHDAAIREAEARGMERAAEIAKDTADQFVGYMSRIERAIRAEAAAIRAQKGE